MEPNDRETIPAPGAAVEPDQTWAALLEAYRSGPKKRWSGPLIERLGPWLTNARKTLIAVPPYLDEEDVAQQLVLQVLRMAARWRPVCEDSWIPRKLVEAAGRHVRRSLKRARRITFSELDASLEASETAEPDLLFETPIGSASAADLRVIYRVKVLGEPVAKLAKEAGVTPRQMRQRVFDARKRARALASNKSERA
jgi:DNA-directed RNA polymerase specialized sigma24 family protein